MKDVFAIEFKPKKSEKVVISIRIDKEIVEKADMVANNLDLSRNELLCQSIEFALDNMSKETKNKK